MEGRLVHLILKFRKVKDMSPALDTCTTLWANSKTNAFFHGPCLQQKVPPFSMELQTSMGSIFVWESRARGTMSDF